MWQVNELLQVEGFTHIFALGDCCNFQVFPPVSFLFPLSGRHAKRCLPVVKLGGIYIFITNLFQFFRKTRWLPTQESMVRMLWQTSSRKHKEARQVGIVVWCCTQDQVVSIISRSLRNALLLLLFQMKAYKTPFVGMLVPVGKCKVSSEIELSLLS
jgi:hypothetical protein